MEPAAFQPAYTALALPIVRSPSFIMVVSREKNLYHLKILVIDFFSQDTTIMKHGALAIGSASAE